MCITLNHSRPRSSISTTALAVYRGRGVIDDILHLILYFDNYYYLPSGVLVIPMQIVAATVSTLNCRDCST